MIIKFQCDCSPREWVPVVHHVERQMAVVGDDEKPVFFIGCSKCGKPVLINGMTSDRYKMTSEARTAIMRVFAQSELVYNFCIECGSSTDGSQLCLSCISMFREQILDGIGIPAPGPTDIPAPGPTDIPAPGLKTVDEFLKFLKEEEDSKVEVFLLVLQDHKSTEYVMFSTQEQAIDLAHYAQEKLNPGCDIKVIALEFDEIHYHRRILYHRPVNIVRERRTVGHDEGLIQLPSGWGLKPVQYGDVIIIERRSK